MGNTHNERTLLLLAFFSIAVLLTFGTFLFQLLEGWSTLDAFYFTGVTMLTIGYGDIYPHSAIGKVAAVAFGFVSIGIVLYSVNLLARLTFRHQLEDFRWLMKKK